MNPIRSLSCIALALTLTLGSALSASAGSATAQLQYLDKTSYSGSLDVSVDLYDPPKKPGQYVAPKRYPAKLLFERPDRFRLVLRPGAKDEFIAVAQGGIVRWLDRATGISGKEEAGKVTDPLALALLGSAGELLRFSASKDLVLPKGSKLSGARLQPNTWGTGIEQGLAWFSSDGKLVGFEFLLADGTKVFVSVLLFQQNPQLPPDAWKL
jgi:outer membrane lipoprotein-sorting protein